MDHPCYKCGHLVEDGKPFCAQCGAPQIRVAMPEALTQAASGNVSSSDLPVFSLDPPIISGTLNTSALTGGIDGDKAGAKRDVETVFSWLHDVLLCGSQVVEAVEAEETIDGDFVDAHEVTVVQDALSDQKPGGDVLDAIIFRDDLQ